MRYVFLISFAHHEERVGFFAESEEAARQKAIEWAGQDGTVGECVERWSCDA